jgi:signal transduction histidine kinase
VRDSGIGIAQDRRSELFKPFRQIDSSFARAHDGAGVGLSQVKHMADLHGGTVEVESEPGVGSEFTVTIPWRMASTRSRRWCRIASNDMLSP